MPRSYRFSFSVSSSCAFAVKRGGTSSSHIRIRRQRQRSCPLRKMFWTFAVDDRSFCTQAPPLFSRCHGQSAKTHNHVWHNFCFARNIPYFCTKVWGKDELESGTDATTDLELFPFLISFFLSFLFSLKSWILAILSWNVGTCWRFSSNHFSS